jgi:hypothetical protein
MKSNSAAVIFRIFPGTGLLLLIISGVIFYNIINSAITLL